MDISEKKEAALKQTTKTRKRKTAGGKQRLSSGVQKRATARKPLEERLDFEDLLIDISKRFIVVSDDRLDSEIKLAIQLVCKFLDIDVCTVWQLAADNPGRLFLTHKYVPPGFPPVQQFMDAKETFPWTLSRVLQGESVILSKVQDAPEEAAQDKITWQHYGIKSIAALPLYTDDGPVFGTLSFDTTRKERDWPHEIIRRLRLVTDIFANTLTRKMTAIALSDSQDKLSVALDSADAGAWSIDFRTGNVWATAKARDLYGFSADEVITRDHYIRAHHPDDRDMAIGSIHRQFQGNSDFHTQYRVLLPDGRIRWIKARAKGYYNPSGELERLTGVSLDISQRKQAEIDVAQMRLELAHLSRITMMNEISSSLAHEINQPLGAILNNATAGSLLMSRNKDSHEEINHILKDIIEDTRRAGDVIRKIRGVVKKSEVQFERLNINNVILESIELARTSIIISKISLHLDLQPDIQDVQGDRIHLQQVVMNLISNAVEAMAQGPLKELTMRTGMTAPDTVTVSVIDSGKGIDDKLAEKIFEPFFTTKKEGLGMGLRICRSIVGEHGGQIRAENNAAGGATVSFSLKACKEGPA